MTSRPLHRWPWGARYFVRALFLVVSLTGCADCKCGARKRAPLVEQESRSDGIGEAGALFQIERMPVFGSPLPAAAQRLQLSGTTLTVNGVTYDTDSLKRDLPFPTFTRGERLVLLSDRDTFVAQAAKILALIDDSGAETWLAYRSQNLGYQIKLRDEEAFRRWLEEAKPGRIRIIQREDGLELQTNVGKLPGTDSHGPTLPLRDGELDIAALRRALARLKTRFTVADEICVVPSHGTELAKITDVLSGCFESENQPSFSQLCLVYPRPPPADGGP